MKALVIAIIAVFAVNAIGAWGCMRMSHIEREMRLKETLDTSTLLLEYSSTLRASKNTQEKLLKDLEEVRLQHMLMALWRFREKPEHAHGMAIVLREYFQRHNVSLNREIVTDPELWKATLNPDEGQ